MAGEWRQRLAHALMMASGFASLGYEIVWTQQCAVWLGHEAAAVLAVVAAFFGGLAAGALVFGVRIARSSNPIRWYAWCEGVVAVWASLLLAVIDPFSASMLRLTGAQPTAGWQWLVAFVGTFLLLLPATAAMGATLPAMERITANWRAGGRSIASLYASNTFGATAGVLAAAFWLIPDNGLRNTAVLCIALNVLCGALSLMAFGLGGKAAHPAHLLAPRKANTVLLLRLFMTGLLGIGYEVLVVRVLSEVAEDTVYTFALLLAVYLVGTAGGAAAYQRWLARSRQSNRTTERLLGALAMACVLGTASLWLLESIKDSALGALGASAAAAMAVEGLLALAAFGLPTVFMGAVFSHLSSEALTSGMGFGRALGVNMLGGATAPLLFGVLALPAFGAKGALLLVAAGYVLLVARHFWREPHVWGAGAAVAALMAWAPPLAFIDVPPDGHLVSYREGALAAVSVVADADGVAVLRINNRQQEGSSATVRVDSRQAWLPLLLHPSPRRALFLGLGTGVTAAAAASDAALEVDAVELLPEVIEASVVSTRVFMPEPPSARLHVMPADARRYLRATDRRYDVIVADNFHPARSGSGLLYTVEHFQAVRGRLQPGGIFCQWLPLHQLDLDTLRSIVRSFLQAFPNGWALLASNSLETPVLGLVAPVDGQRLDLHALRHRLDMARAPRHLDDLGLEDDFALLGGFVAGPEALRRFAGDATVNTDDRPIVSYRSPRITYAPDSQPRDRLLALLKQVSIDPGELLATSPGDEWPHRLAAYWLARDRFIAAGRDVRPSVGVDEILAQVQEPLLAVLRISPDFRPAYEPLARMSTMLESSDAPRARALTNELASIRDTRQSSMLH